MSQESMAAAADASFSFRETTRHSLKAQAEGNPTFFESLSRTFRRNVHRIPEAFFHYPPIIELLPGVEEKNFVDPKHEVPIHYYVSRAPVERGVVVACTGLKEPISLSNERIKALHAQGLSYICLRLPNVGIHSHFMPLYEEYVKFFFLHPESPVHKLFDHLKDNMVAEGHSTGGYIILKQATHPETAKGMKQYRAIFVDAPFTDSPSSSQEDPWWRQIAFTSYARLQGNKSPEATLLGNFYIILGDIKYGKIKVPEDAANDLFFAVQKTIEKFGIVLAGGEPWEKEIPEEAKGLQVQYRLPTYDQILEIRQCGRDHKAFLRKNGVPDHAPIYIYADPADNFSSFKADKVWADLIGATLIESSGQHSTLNKDQAVFDHFTKTIERDLPPWPAPKVVITHVDFGNGIVELLKTPEPPPIQTKGRWHRLPPVKAAIELSQAPGRLWNSASDMVQRAFGRGAKQPEPPLALEYKAPVWEVTQVTENSMSLRGRFPSSASIVAAPAFGGYSTQPGALALDGSGDGTRLAL